MSYHHQPVLLQEVLKYLNPKKNQNFIDCTLGGGGHTEAILKKIMPKGHLIGIDRDPRAIKAALKKLIKYKKQITLVQDSYKNINKIIYENGSTLHFNGLLLDLGISSAQISSEDSRGFSFQQEQKLDMRFGPDTDLTAAQILNEWPKNKLIDLLRNYGEVKEASDIANIIINSRARKPFELTSELVELCLNIRGQQKRFYAKKKIHPATKIFQALRIAVNNELENLEEALPELLKALSVGGRIAVISYHSLEDRIVKNFFRHVAKECHCPKEIPVCRCNHKSEVKILTKKPIIPLAEEIQNNPRSRSAKLRVVEKI